MAVSPLSDRYRSTPLIVSAGLTVGQTRRLRGDSGLSRRFNQILRAASRQITLRIQAVSPVRTGLFRRRWTATVEGESVALSNSVRYAQYVHPKGTPRSRTVANVDAPRIIADVQDLVDQEVADLLATIVLYEEVAAPVTPREVSEYESAKRKFDAWVNSVARVPGARIPL
jgi:hypothetical protein